MKGEFKLSIKKNIRDCLKFFFIVVRFFAIYKGIIPPILAESIVIHTLYVHFKKVKNLKFFPYFTIIIAPKRATKFFMFGKCLQFY